MTRKFGEIEFTVEKYSSIMDGKTYVSFTSPTNPPFKATAGANGISFMGVSHVISTMSELNAFAELVGELWKEHVKLAPNLRESLTGH